MKVLFTTAATILLVATIIGLSSFLPKETIDTTDTTHNTFTKSKTKIQVAILLDVSNSMDGLIEQAKAQLWNMVSVMGKAETNSQQTPSIEIALYEYGRSSNDSKQGYIKQINPFTSDLDDISQNLFKLTTNGGDEYCTNVMYTSLTELNWDQSASNYKVIFIAGNEDFLQGNITYIQACNEAKKKGVIVNTIYCGSKMQGIKEHWNLSECGNGSYTNINQDAKEIDIPTPYDSMIFTLNNKLNSTYIAYGSSGHSKLQAQAEVDEKSYESNKSAALKRAQVKGSGGLYRNSGWDLVDAFDDDSSIVSKVDLKTLPENLKSKTRSQLKQFIKDKRSERGTIQKDMASLSLKRDAYITAEKAKAANTGKEATLESEIEKIIRSQAKQFNMVIK